MTRLYSNNFSTTLNGAITDVATTMTLTSVTDFPAVGSGDTAQVTITDGTNVEVVTATAIAGSDVTITRGQEGTSGTAFADTSTVEIRATALSFTDVLAADETPVLAGPLDTSGTYLSFGGSSSATTYSLNHSGGVPRLTGPVNFHWTFTSSALYAQAGTTFNRIEFKNDSDRLRVYTNNSERLQVDDSGVNVSNGTLVVNSNDVHADGISFDSGTNVLDYYETGTFTPVLSATSVAPSVTYSSRSGSYIRIGNLVYIQVAIAFSSQSGGSGSIQITGLPFTTDSGAFPHGSTYISTYNFAAANSYLIPYAGLSATYVQFLEVKDNASGVNAAIAGLSASGAVNFTLAYQI